MKKVEFGCSTSLCVYYTSVKSSTKQHIVKRIKVVNEREEARKIFQNKNNFFFREKNCEKFERFAFYGNKKNVVYESICLVIKRCA